MRQFANLSVQVKIGVVAAVGLRVALDTTIARLRATVSTAVLTSPASTFRYKMSG